jgi:SAM-dependent methyltransferase
MAILFGLHLDKTTPLNDQPLCKNILAIGISDHPCYAGALERMFRYRNTFLHTNPRLDLCDSASVSEFADLDLITCSDVLEHTGDPPVVTMRRLRDMLRPGGFAVVSVPTYHMPETIEWYPGARSVHVVKLSAQQNVVVWETLRGSIYTDTTPAFHGGPGDVLEMRICSQSGVLSTARAVGFEPKVLEFDPSVGYGWPIQTEYPGLDAVMDGRITIMTRLI